MAEQWKQDHRRDVILVDIGQFVPQNHLLRKIERVIDYDWLYGRLSPNNGRNGADPVVLIKSICSAYPPCGRAMSE